MIYDKRNRENLNKLADNTKIAAYKWYDYCLKNGYELLIYETIRTAEKQRQNIKKGVSQTMKSYHIVGQALDFVFIDKNGKELWSLKDYTSKIQVINYAKSLGFTWGADWDNDGKWTDETFIDSPHLQYNWKGYGSDTFGKVKPSPDVKSDVKDKLGYNAPKDSKAYRIHTGAYTSKSIAISESKKLVANGYLGYSEVFGNDKDGYRVQSGKYNTQKDAEAVAIRMLQAKVIGYASIIGTKE
ncbi:M15 family metallopeptidase [Lysinibacillus agricola]|uniref:M15 family metallopeptidase n=1 Tax=Lysinibacillus agricola TaxID=2590012 RepID=UPI003C1E2DCB